MRAKFLLLAFLLVGVAGCDQPQTQIAALRTEFERQLKARDNTIAELTRQNGELRSSQGTAASDKLAEAVTESVSKRLEQQNATGFGEVKTRLDEIIQSLKIGSPNSPTANGPSAPNPGDAPRGGASPPGPNSNVKDPSRKKYKFDF